jgi:hypothetical protein
VRHPSAANPRTEKREPENLENPENPANLENLENPANPENLENPANPENLESAQRRAVCAN